MGNSAKIKKELEYLLSKGVDPNSKKINDLIKELTKINSGIQKDNPKAILKEYNVVHHIVFRSEEEMNKHIKKLQCERKLKQVNIGGRHKYKIMTDGDNGFLVIYLSVYEKWICGNINTVEFLRFIPNSHIINSIYSRMTSIKGRIVISSNV